MLEKKREKVFDRANLLDLVNFIHSPRFAISYANKRGIAEFRKPPNWQSRSMKFDYLVLQDKIRSLMSKIDFSQLLERLEKYFVLSIFTGKLLNLLN